MFVFVALTSLFTYLIVFIGKQQVKLVKGGLDDQRIIKDVNKKLKRKKKCCCQCGLFDKILSIFFCVVLGVICVVSVAVGVTGDGVVKGVPVLKVVATSSMSARYEKNEYLFNHNLTDQLQVFDLVVLHELPPEDQLELYDIVVYEHITGTLLIHRIVNIEEPNQKHPNERYFLLQGDANSSADVFPVRYSQMKSIYRGEKIPNVGSFVYFMQSPAGIICFILVAFAVCAIPVVSKKFNALDKERVVFLVENKQLDKNALEFYKTKKELKAQKKLKKEKNNKDA